MNDGQNIEVCLEYLLKIDCNNPPNEEQNISKYMSTILEDSHTGKFSVTEKDASGSRITVREYWREREEFQKSKSYSALLNHYDGAPEESSFEPVKITFWDARIGQFSVWF